jgi:trehalose 6-phosphate phosphatase
MPLPLIATDWALFLDVDGTLIEFVPRPEDARVPGKLKETLAMLGPPLGGALALVSGRALASVEQLFAPLHLAAAGQHGAEARLSPEGPIESFAPPPAALNAVLAAAQPYLAAHPALRVEYKGFSAAIHYRGVEALRDELKAVLGDAVAPHADILQILDSHLCFDVKPRVANKGVAIDRFMAAAPFRGRKPVFIGDDRTDEDGFAAVQALGGLAVKVGFSAPTLATERVDSPAELRLWLERSAHALTQPV